MDEQQMSVAELFSQLDTDNDGRINGPELHKGLSKIVGESLSPGQVSVIIQSIDSDSDNRVDMYELRVALENAKWNSDFTVSILATHLYNDEVE